jgi:hypothetical protein
MFHLTLGLRLNEIGSFGGMGLANICFSDMGYSDPKYGFIDGVMGIAEPPMTVSNQLLKEFTCEANGNFILAFGDAGNEPILDDGDIIMNLLVYDKSGKYGDVAVWDEITKQYTFISVEFSDAMIDTIVNGNKELCIGVSVAPELMIHYDFGEIK